MVLDNSGYDLACCHQHIQKRCIDKLGWSGKWLKPRSRPTPHSFEESNALALPRSPGPGDWSARLKRPRFPATAPKRHRTATGPPRWPTTTHARPSWLTICPKSPQDRPPDGHKWSKSPPLEGHQEAHGFIKTQMVINALCCVAFLLAVTPPEASRRIQSCTR